MPSFFKNITIDDVGYVKLPVGDTSQRPGNTQNGQIRFNSDRGIPEFRDNAQAEWKRQNAPGQVVATGGDAVYDIAQFGKKYRVHVFTQDGTFSVSKGGDVEYLVVAGGGGGGHRPDTSGSNVGGAGGGAGGLLQGNINISSSQTVIVGSGGAGASGSSTSRGSSGEDSEFGDITAIGGGGGGTRTGTITGGDGGSGGGGTFSGGAGGSGTNNQGFDGGTGSSSNSSPGAGGGGGAGAAGENGQDPKAGDGGIGVSSSIAGDSIFYAGGGGGARDSKESANDEGIGGLGGGGDNNQNGTVNTGGGGGGGIAGTDGGSGGSGIVVARYEIRDQEQLTAADQDITEGLVLDLDFAKPTVYTGSGSTVSDSRLFPIEGSINGASYVNARTHRAAFDFDGVDDKIEMSKIADFSADITVEVWANARQFGNHYLLNNYSGSGEWFLLNVNNDNGISWGVDDASTNLNVNTAGDLSTNEWYHIIGFYDSANTSLELYLNGSLIASNSAGSSNYNPTYKDTIYLGGRGEDDNRQFDGLIAKARVYSRVLSSDEIQQRFNLTRWRFGV